MRRKLLQSSKRRYVKFFIYNLNSYVKFKTLNHIIFTHIKKPIAKPPAAKPKQEEAPTQSQDAPAEQVPPIPKEQVIVRLRQRGEPVTLFGETDWQRYQRLHHLDERDPIEYIEGMDNEFAREVKEIEREEEKRAIVAVLSIQIFSTSVFSGDARDNL